MKSLNLVKALLKKYFSRSKVIAAQGIKETEVDELAILAEYHRYKKMVYGTTQPGLLSIEREIEYFEQLKKLKYHNIF